MRHVLLVRERRGYRAYAASIPQCKAYGDTVQEAITTIREAIRDYEDHLSRHNHSIPDERIDLTHVADDITPPGIDDVRIFVSMVQPPTPAGEQWAMERLQELKLVNNDR